MLPHELERAILDAIHAYRHTVDVSRELRIDTARADSAYTKVKAMNYHTTTGKVAEREAQLDILTEHERQEYLIAKATSDAQQELVKYHSAELSALQTLAALMRAEMALAGKGET